MKDISGSRFGMLVAIAPAGKHGRNWKWYFQCDCGSFSRKTASAVTRDAAVGRPSNCGCKTNTRMAAAAATHAMSHHQAYKVWAGMKRRCGLRSHDSYKYYGGRGIKVCPEWQASFEAFWADMGLTYEPGLQIDRIDTNGNYSPENCRWTTSKANARNKRNNRMIKTPWGVITVSEASERAGLSRATIDSRLRHGWDSMPAVTTPAWGAV